MERINVIDGLKKKYIIPCFQREYSWGEEEIDELIKNIKNIKNKDDYCIGIITIQNEKDASLLIDGQQRLTTLYLIAIYCGLIKKKNEVLLNFEYEELVSNENDLVNLLLNKENISQSIEDGYRIISKKISDKEKSDIISTMKKVYYYEIDVDDGIDLNHYFEVMNSRGVQLSRSDIIKSYLMKFLDSNKDRFKLNHLWYKYEKMDDIKSIFTDFEHISKKMKSDYKSINEILKSKNANSNAKEIIKNNDDINDNSILNFEYFLLYIIRLYKNIDDDNYLISGEFNLADLIKEYEDWFSNKNSEEVVKFLNFMITMKNNYDRYIVKYDNNSETWSLAKNSKNTDMLLIQSCLRVSFVNRRLMHWIYMTLKYFYNHKDITVYNKLMRDYIKDKYIQVFLTEIKSVDYKTGFDTPIIVLNYLDLIIKENFDYVVNKIPLSKGLKPQEFKFKFRNSIEHFKPRHDKDGNENPKWVDDLGNLALLSYGTNTKMQNAEPDEKAKHFDKELSGYSLKLQIMTRMALSNVWNEQSAYNLRNIMLNLLEKDLNK